jgi:hypothetical protein
MSEDSINTAADKVTEGLVGRAKSDHDRLICVTIELKYLVDKLNGHIDGEEQMMSDWKIMLEDMNNTITNTYSGISRLMRTVYIIGAGFVLFVIVDFLGIPLWEALSKLF